MRIRDRARTLALRSVLILATLSLTVTQAYAAPNHPKDDGIRCAYFNRQTGAWEFYVPGDTLNLQDSQGNLVALACGVDGNWYRQGARSGPNLQGSGGSVVSP